jgi:ATP-binding protein involved in chromosome partitioning
MAEAADTSNLDRVKNKIVVLSGKGGVGKSTVAVNLAVTLSELGYQTGILDVDVHGPSVPKLLGLDSQKMGGTAENRLIPATYSPTLKAVSVGFILENSTDAVIWRGSLKHNVIKQFMFDTEWGELDFLIIDSPPGTGDEVLSSVQLLPEPTGAVVITTPQDLALLDVSKSITFCSKLNLPVLGIVENMSGFACPHCGEISYVFKQGGGQKISQEMNVPYLGEIPISLNISHGADEGKPIIHKDHTGDESPKAFQSIVTKLLENSRIVK